MLLTLPYELLLQITEFIHRPSHILNLRLAGNRRLAQAGLEALQKATQVIHLDLSKVSLERFRVICHSAGHARHI